MKLVREHINEAFTDDSDPIHDMGIGLKLLFNEWAKKINKSYGNTSINKIDSIYTITAGKFDIGSPISKSQALRTPSGKLPQPIIIRGNVITELPDFISFNKCYGDCMMNVSNLKSLRGTPRIIYGNFCINSNHNLFSLDFFPEKVYGHVYADHCGRKFTREELRSICEISGDIIRV